MPGNKILNREWQIGVGFGKRACLSFILSS